jgi:hypothetical protein
MEPQHAHRFQRALHRRCRGVWPAAPPGQRRARPAHAVRDSYVYVLYVQAGLHVQSYKLDLSPQVFFSDAIFTIIAAKIIPGDQKMVQKDAHAPCKFSIYYVLNLVPL